MSRIDTHQSSKLTFAEGAAASTPAAALVVLYAKADGLLYSKDDAGAESAVSGAAGGGDVATDDIWDAAGDLVQGTGANTAAKLTLGAAGTVVRSTGSTNAYAFPPGHVYSYIEGTSNVAPTATAEASADVVVTADAVAFDGSTVIEVEFYCYGARPDVGAVDRVLDFWLYDGASSIGRMGRQNGPAAQSSLQPVLIKRRLTPSAATHTYSIRSTTSAGTALIGAGAGGSGNAMPLYIMVKKAT